MSTTYLDRGAVLSRDVRYRYGLWRTWAREGSCAMFVGLNPSTADAEKDDPTIRRCVAFAKAWGCAGLMMTNLFAFRATMPEVMLAERDPVGPDNDYFLRRYAAVSSLVVAAWGVHGAHQRRAAGIEVLLGSLQCLGVNKDGSPKHPLYLPASSTLRPWSAP